MYKYHTTNIDNTMIIYATNHRYYILYSIYVLTTHHGWVLCTAFILLLQLDNNAFTFLVQLYAKHEPQHPFYSKIHHTFYLILCLHTLYSMWASTSQPRFFDSDSHLYNWAEVHAGLVVPTWFGLAYLICSVNLVIIRMQCL